LGMTHRQFRRISSTVRGIVNAVQSSVLLLPPDAQTRAPVVVVYDGSPASERALSVARYLAQMQDNILTVLTTGKSEEQKAEVVEQLEGSGLAVRYRSMPDVDIASMTQVTRHEAAGTVVLCASLYLKEGTLEDLLERLDCAVLLVR
jgi:hypothetical protein